MNDKKVLWDEFWEKYNILKNGAPLFETKMSLCNVGSKGERKLPASAAKKVQA